MENSGFNPEKLRDSRPDKEGKKNFAYEEKQRSLRLIKGTLKNRKDFLDLQCNIVEKIKAAGSDPEKIARLERRIQKEEEKSAAMRKREHELETEIAEHLGPEASLLDEESPSRMDS